MRTGAKVTDLIRGEQGRITGVRYRDHAGAHELSAAVVIGADGRFSKLRRLAGAQAHSLGAATDLLWFRLPRRADDPPEADVDLHFGRDHYVGLLAGAQGWQVGYSLPKGGYAAAREAGVEPIRDFVAIHVPWLGDRVHVLTDFTETTLLPVDIARVEQWWRPGLLLIGDAAHIISPVGGNGILMAVQDAVAAANHLVPALHRDRPVPDAVLCGIQAEREPAIRYVQCAQVRTEQRAARARGTGRPIGPPPRLFKLMTVLPGVRARAAAANAYGPHPPLLSALCDVAAPSRPARECTQRPRK